MKRGLVEWSQAELPREILEARLARCQAMLGERGLDAAVFYTSVAQPVLVRYLTHFLPYWNEGVLVLPGSGPPLLCVGLSNRVFPWIRGSSCLTEIRPSRNLGADAARALQEWGARRVGLADRGGIPHGVIAELQAGLADGELVDLPDIVDTLRLGADPAELWLRNVAGQVAARALDELGTPTAGMTDSTVAASLDRAARLAGAEDTLILVGPAGRWPGLPCGVALPARIHVLMQVEYKGHWVQVGRTLGAPADVGWRDRLAALCQPGADVGGIVESVRRDGDAQVYLSRGNRGSPFTGLGEGDRLAEGDVVAAVVLDPADGGSLHGDTYAVQAEGVRVLS